MGDATVGSMDHAYVLYYDTAWRDQMIFERGNLLMVMESVYLAWKRMGNCVHVEGRHIDIADI